MAQQRRAPYRHADVRADAIICGTTHLLQRVIDRLREVLAGDQDNVAREIARILDEYPTTVETRKSILLSRRTFTRVRRAHDESIFPSPSISRALPRPSFCDWRADDGMDQLFAIAIPPESIQPLKSRVFGAFNAAAIDDIERAFPKGYEFNKR